MHSEHPGVPLDSSAVAHEVRRGNHVDLRRTSPASPGDSERPRPDDCQPSTAHNTVVDRRQPSVAGQLAVRWENEDGTLIMWLDGALDEATVTLLDRELDARAIGLMGVVIDLTGLEFIDSSGLDALVGVHWRASKRSDRLSFRHGRRLRTGRSSSPGPFAFVPAGRRYGRVTPTRTLLCARAGVR